MRLAFIMLIIAMLLNAFANLLMKHSANLTAPDATLVDKIFSPAGFWLCLGLILFAANVIFYRIALEGIDVSVGYPIMVGGGLVIISLVAIFMFGEGFSAKLLIGYVLLFIGLLFISLHVSDQEKITSQNVKQETRSVADKSTTL